METTNFYPFSNKALTKKCLREIGYSEIKYICILHTYSSSLKYNPVASINYAINEWNGLLYYM